jgi:predicted DNA-binding transcriptional regulator AlpA
MSDDTARGDLLIDTGPAGEYLGKSYPTMVRWRQIGEGPDFIRIGRHVKYRKSALDRFLEECTHRPRRRHAKQAA